MIRACAYFWALNATWRKASAHQSSVMSNLDYVPKPKNRVLEAVNESVKEEESINAKWQCDPVAPENEHTHNDYHFRGVNLGGWLVLEPWITPTLFFQFLGKDVEAVGIEEHEGEVSQDDVAMDMHSFCVALGPEEANRQLRAHWKSWVTEKDIAQLASMGISTVRLPMGDWMYKPYGPYINCTDEALDEVERLFDMCKTYGIKVLLDIHGHKDSQNGFDNSGHARQVNWTTLSSNMAAGNTATFVHWPLRTAEWIGSFDSKTATYTSKNENNVQHSLDVISMMVDMYWNESSVLGLQPVNEPWQFTPLDWLKDFYWDAYQIMRKKAPGWVYLMHDAFRYDPVIWGDFMLNCPNIGLDTHIYQAWLDPAPQATYLVLACNTKKAIESMENMGMPVVVGEWSLATDNCAMWLNGFNDNLPGYPRVTCRHTTCPLPYTGPGVIPGAPVNPQTPTQGPYGTGQSTPSFGQCPIGSGWIDEDVFMRKLGHAKLYSMDVGHGFFFWNFKTELEDRWSYIGSVNKGYIPHDAETFDSNERIQTACDRFNGKGRNFGQASSSLYELVGPRHSCYFFSTFTMSTVVQIVVVVMGLVSMFYIFKRNNRYELL